MKFPPEKSEHHAKGLPGKKGKKGLAVLFLESWQGEGKYPINGVHQKKKKVCPKKGGRIASRKSRTEAVGEGRNVPTLNPRRGRAGSAYREGGRGRSSFPLGAKEKGKGLRFDQGQRDPLKKKPKRKIDPLCPELGKEINGDSS